MLPLVRRVRGQGACMQPRPVAEGEVFPAGEALQPQMEDMAVLFPGEVKAGQLVGKEL